jgi:hypothetical protein
VFATKTDELLVAFRQDVDDYSAYTVDNDAVCLWKDSEIYRYMTVACDALARDALGLTKTLTLSYLADTPRVNLPRYVLHIHSARDTTQGRPLELANTNSDALTAADDYGSRRMTSYAMFEGSGPVAFIVRDYERQALRLVPIPNAAGEIELQCTVTIAEALKTGALLPFFETVDLQLVLEHMKSQAYRKQDVETEDLVRARTALQAYTVGVAERKSSTLNYRRAPGVVRASY